jgi:hypothetical protein
MSPRHVLFTSAPSKQHANPPASPRSDARCSAWGGLRRVNAAFSDARRLTHTMPSSFSERVGDQSRMRCHRTRRR